METKTCHECGTENEKDYIYCKNCGAKLDSAETVNNMKSAEVNAPHFIDGQEVSQTNSNYEKPPLQLPVNTDSGEAYGGTPHYSAQYNTYNQNPNYNYNYNVDGIPAEDVACFVGKKSSEIMPKFMKMEITKSKVSWCWPAAILGLILGPMGSAVWFFYRKMYKIALIFLVIGAAVTLTTSTMTYNTNSKTIKDVFGAFSGQNAGSLLDSLDKIGGDKTVLDVAAESINDCFNVASCVIAGIFGFFFYKNNCVEKIRGFRQNGVDQRYYKLALASIGGTSGGMLAVGIVAIFLISNLASAVTFLLSIL